MQQTLKRSHLNLKYKFVITLVIRKEFGFDNFIAQDRKPRAVDDSLGSQIVKFL